MVTQTIYVQLSGITDVYQFCQNMLTLQGDVVLSRGRFAVDGKSILGLFSIDLSQPTKVEYYGDEVEEFLFLTNHYRVYYNGV